MKFSEYYARTKARKLTQIEAASLLGMSERSFRRYGKRLSYEFLSFCAKQEPQISILEC